MKVRVFFVFALIFLSFFVFSCARNTKKTFGAEFDRIDAYISVGQYKDALSELKRIEKKVSNSWDFIGIYRRYTYLGQNEYATNDLKNAFKKHASNDEIRALYSHNLLRLGQTQQALEVAESLRGTRYGSFYAEALLKQANSQVSNISPLTNDRENNFIADYLSADFFSIYYDAYTGSKDSYWLRNAAIVGMMAGDNENVRVLRPERYTSLSDAFFWALVQYDNGNYGDAENSLSQAKSFYEISSYKERTNISFAEFIALFSDVYQALSENDKAEYVRQILLSDKAKLSAEGDNSALSYIYVNSAEYASGMGDDERASELLSHTVSVWPDFVPGLISYGNFAYKSSQMRDENITQLSLREAGVATREMQRYDNRAKIPVADALHKMDASIARKRDPLLFIARLDLNYKADNTVSVENKIADLWNVLERNTIGINEYPTLLFEYAVNRLIRYNRIDDAFTLFKKYCISHYGFDVTADFLSEFSKNLEQRTMREIEYMAWFLAYQGLSSDAKNLYETFVFQNFNQNKTKNNSETIFDFTANQRANITREKISATASLESCMNLAMIYAAFGDNKSALELYSASAGRTPDVILKAEILYRMARIYDFEGNKNEAIAVAANACSLDPTNARAQLFYMQLSTK